MPAFSNAIFFKVFPNISVWSYEIFVITDKIGLIIVVAMGMEKIEFFWYLKKIGWLAFVGFLAGFITFVLFEAYIL